MQEIFDSVKLKEQLELNVANLITQNKIELNCSKDELVKKLLSIESQVESSSNRRDSWDELSNYQMLNDQCVYMLQTIPTLVKKKVIGKSLICYGYDRNNDNLITLSTEINGEYIANNYAFRNKLLTKISNDGNIIFNRYDSMGRVVNISLNNLNNYISYEYLDNVTYSNLSHVDVIIERHCDGYEKIFIYQRKYKNRLIKVIENDVVYDITYNNYNQITNVNSENMNISYCYNNKGELIRVIDNKIEKNIEYNNKGNVISLNESYYSESNVSECEYDNRNRLIHVNTNNYVYETYYKYDDLDRIIHAKYIWEGEIITDNQYDYIYKEDQATSLIRSQNFTFNNNCFHNYLFEYDEYGNIISYKEDENNIKYKYDSLNRIIREDNPKLNKTIVYKYNLGNNLLFRKEYEYSLEDMPNNLVNDYNYVYSTNDWKDQLKSLDGKNISYDQKGRMKSYGNILLNWNLKDQLVSYGNVSFTYDEYGQRYSKTIGNNTIYYSMVEGKLLNEYSTSDLTTIKYEYVLEYLIGFVYNNKRFIYERNIMGDIVRIYSLEDRELVAEYKYDAFGEHMVYTKGGSILNSESFIGNINRIRYKGYYYDKETQLYWVSSRYYSPELCRWISPDSIEYLDPESINGLNLYAYCGNDPVNRFDPTGHAFISVLVGLGIAALIGAGIGAASYTAGQLIDYAITGDFEWSWGGFIGSTVGGAIGGAITFATAGIGGAFATMAGAFLSGAAMTSSTMIGENISGDATHSFGDILISSLISGGISMASVGIMSKIKIPSLNSGRGSMSAVSKQMYTKFQRQIIKRVSMRTFTKMLAVEAYNGAAGNIMEWAYGISGAKDYVLNFF